jgi:hypothetical protein
MPTARLKAVAVLFEWEDGTSSIAIKLDRPQISMTKREEIERREGAADSVRFRLDVVGDDITPERELTGAEIVEISVISTVPETIADRASFFRGLASHNVSQAAGGHGPWNVCECDLALQLQKASKGIPA